MEDFDSDDDIKNPNSLTVLELRRFLSSHGVQLPTSTAKKEVYVKLYQEYVKPVQKKKQEISSPRTSTISKPVTPIVNIPSKTQTIQITTPITSNPTPIVEEVLPPIPPPQLEINDFVRKLFALFIVLLWAVGVIFISEVILTHPYDFCEQNSALKKGGN